MSHSRTFFPRVVLIGGCLGLASAAWAAPGADRFPISIADAEARAKAHFEAADIDQSGTVNLAEFEAAEPPRGAPGERRRMRAHAGKHASHAGKRGHPGRRGPAAGPMAGEGAERQAMRAAVEAEVFAIMDTDGDGSLSSAEFQSADRRATRQLARKRALFKRLDADQDSLLTAEEMPNPAARLRQADADGDGLVTRDEIRAHRQARRAARQAENQG